MAALTRYAENTTVPVDRSIGEIVTLIRKNGAERIAQVQEPGFLAIQFFLKDRLLRFRVELPTWQEMPDQVRYQYRSQAQREAKAQQAQRQKARALLLVIKAKGLYAL